MTTNKQIIIDSYSLKDLKDLLFTGQRDVISTKTFEAIIDELERKDKECKRLKLDLIEAKAHGDYLNNLALSETLNFVSEQLDQLKADREEALKQLEFVRTLNTVQEAENRKLSKTLEEIKEIIEQGIKIHDDIIVSKQILRKISECEVENG